MYVKQAMIYKVMFFYIPVPWSKIVPETTVPKIKIFFIGDVGSVWIFVFGLLILALLFSYKSYAALCNNP